MKSYNYYLHKMFKLEIIKTRPKESVKFARKYFKGKEIVVIEIGVFKGENAQDVLSNLNVKKIFLIDPYLKYGDYKSDGSCEEVLAAKVKAHNLLNEYSSKIKWIEDYSEKAVHRFKNDSLDFVYVDGNHTYPYVKGDLKLYWDKVKVGGILAGHDIQLFNVSKALLEFANKNKLDVHFGDRRDWWIVKSKFAKSQKSEVKK